MCIRDRSTTLEMFLAKIDCILLSGGHKDSDIVTMLRKKMHPQVSLKEVGNAIGYSERHVQRIFLEQIGCSTVSYTHLDVYKRQILHRKNNNTVHARIR